MHSFKRRWLNVIDILLVSLKNLKNHSGQNIYHLWGNTLFKSLSPVVGLNLNRGRFFFLHRHIHILKKTVINFILKNRLTKKAVTCVETSWRVHSCLFKTLFHKTCTMVSQLGSKLYIEIYDENLFLWYQLTTRETNKSQKLKDNIT